MSQSSEPIVNFYQGTGRDDRGRSLDEILAWDDETLEGVHDYIQWLFPLDERSAVNPDAPLVTPSVSAAFSADPALRQRLRDALERMLAFYGFRFDEDRIERSPEWPARSRNWLRPYNHNYLRLTRIMKSLALLGLANLARALRDALMKEYDRAPEAIGMTTGRYWRTAVDEIEN